MDQQHILVAMSGGVDSSVAALLLLRDGYKVTGMTARLFGDTSAAGPCCSREGPDSAAAVCEKLGIEHHTADFTELFERRVIDRFISEYRRGRTPNPCSDCNRLVKFDAFLGLARELGCELLATGHHARITGGLLRAGIDPDKDQSYFLACIEPAVLRQLRFPVGAYTKQQVRELAAGAGLPSASREESQDICFLAGGTGISHLLSWHTGTGPQPGQVVDEQGNILGEHPGIEHFTIGQRKGLGLGGGTEGLVVHRLDVERNTVVVAQRDAHPIRSLVLREFTDVAPGGWLDGTEIMARGRYRQPLWPAVAKRTAEGAVVEPEGDLYGMAPGQWCVGYSDETALFGGIIDEIAYR